MNFLRDLKFGGRLLRRNPAFAAVAILTLALGIGANTAVFSVLDAVLLQPPPLPQPYRVVMVWQVMSNGQPNAFTVRCNLEASLAERMPVAER